MYKFKMSKIIKGYVFWNQGITTAIGGKAPLDIWSGGTAQHNYLLWIFISPTYFSVKNDKLNPSVKKFVFLEDKRNLKGYKLCDSKHKKTMLSRYVTFDETSLLKSTVSQ